MKLIFRGHDDRYAVEQSLLAFFPDERPVYAPALPEEDHPVVSLREGKTYTTATTRLTYQGQTVLGMSRVKLGGVDDEYE